MIRDPIRVYPLAAGALLGAIGLAIGYVAPIKFDPGAIQGPLVGVFFTGPLSLALGAALGYVSAKLRFGPLVFAIALAIAAAGVAAGSLYLSLPGARWQAFVIDAEMRDCLPSPVFRGETLDRMRKLVEKNPGWATRPDWAAEFERKAIAENGVVLTMLVHRRLDIFEDRNPGHVGELSAHWKQQGKTEKYFARWSGRDCSQYPVGTRGFYAPDWELSPASSPGVVPPVMGLYVLQPVPAQFRRFLSPGA